MASVGYATLVAQTGQEYLLIALSSGLCSAPDRAATSAAPPRAYGGGRAALLATRNCVMNPSVNSALRDISSSHRTYSPSSLTQFTRVSQHSLP
jgi:hypothetical protein